MTHYINYTLTYTYTGRLATEADTLSEAETKVSRITPDLLKAVSDKSSSTIQVRGERTQDELQLSIFTEEDDDGN